MTYKNYNSEPNPFHLKSGIYEGKLREISTTEEGDIRFVFFANEDGMAALNVESMDEVRNLIRAWFPDKIPGFSGANEITNMAHLHSFIGLRGDIEVVARKYQGKKVKFRYICDIGPIGTLTAKKKAERKSRREQERLEAQELAKA